MSGLVGGAARFCLVTGASSGIGRAVAVRLSRSGAAVLAVARREELLRETQALGAPGRIEVVAADVTTEAGRAAIAGAVAASGRRLDWVVQNAGAIFIAQAARARQEQWRELFELNVHAPLFLLQRLLPHLAPGARVLHIGSGAAHKPYDGWSSYCVTKAAFFMLYQCLRDELAPQGVLVGSVKPGIIESPMQEVCRSPAGLGESKLVGLFQQFKDNEYKPSQGDSEDRPHAPTTTGLDTAANCAHFIRFLLQDTADDEYKAQEWDIRDPVHHSRWVTH